MSRAVTGERPPASERDDCFGGHQRERVQRGGPWRPSLKPPCTAGILPPGTCERIPRRPIRNGQSAGIAMCIGSALRSTRAQLPAIAVIVPRTRRQQCGLHRPCDPIGTNLGLREHRHPCSRAKNT